MLSLYGGNKEINQSKIIMLKYFSLEFTICNAVELSHKKSNFAIPTPMMNLRKQKISRLLIVYFKTKLTQHLSSQIDMQYQNKCTSCDLMMKLTRFVVNIKFAEDKCR